MTPETVAAVALDILRERGWHQGGAVGPGGEVCLVAAMTITAEDSTSFWEVARRIDCVLDLNPIRGLASWNDDPHTTFEDVTLVLKRVANGEGVA